MNMVKVETREEETRGLTLPWTESRDWRLMHPLPFSESSLIDIVKAVVHFLVLRVSTD